MYGRFGRKMEVMVLRLFGFSLKAAFKSARARQAVVLYASLVVSLILGIIVSVINTRLLGPKAFGDFKLIQTVWTVGVLFVTCGFLTTGGNLLAEKKTVEAEKPLMGSLLAIAMVISLVFIVMMIGASFPFGYLYGQAFGEKIRLYDVLLFVFPLQMYLQEVLRGTNDIYNLSILNALPQLAYIPAVLIVNQLYGFSLDLALLLTLLSMAATVFLIIARVKPVFSSMGAGIRTVVNNNQAIGLHVYFATLLTTSTAYLGNFTLGYFSDTRVVGEFALALTITMPLMMVPNAIATTFFKHFASLDRIPTKVIMASALLSMVTLAGFFIVIKMIIVFLYTERFIVVVPLAYICAAASVLHGMGDVFNRYLLARGKTSMLRSNAMQLSAISVLGYVFLVAWKGAMGAAFTKLVVDVAYLLTMVIYYKRLRANKL